MNRFYTDVGVNSKGSVLTVQDTDGKYAMLCPVVTMPSTLQAPETVDKTVLSDETMTNVEGMQSVDTKEYTFNYHRDNIKQLLKYRGKTLNFMEMSSQFVGETFSGTLTFGRNDKSTNSVDQGTIYVVVNKASTTPISNALDLYKETAIITSPLNDVTLSATENIVIPIETSPNATVKVTSDSADVATAEYAEGKLTITGVAKGNTLVNLETSATGEATSYRTILVIVA